MWLAKPDKTIITSLFEIEPTISYKVSNIDEMTFNMPAFLEEEDYFEENPNDPTEKYGREYPIKNPHIKLLSNRKLIKVLYNDQEEWFIIMDSNKTGEEDREYVAIQSYSLGYELKDTTVFNYTTKSATLRQILAGNYLDGTKGILSDTQWSIGYMDKRYDKVYRTFDSYTGTVLQAIVEDLKTMFEYIVEFDTENRLLNFYYIENYGNNSGIVFNEQKYLKTINEDKNADSEVMCTRLYCRGKDNLDISSINPTGQPYIDDFSYFMYPFEMTRDGTILKHSDNMMSDDLCVAITKYQAKIMAYRGKIYELTDRKNTYDSLVLYKNQELNSLKNQKSLFADKLAVAQGSGNSTQPIIDIQEQIESDITNKKNEVDEIQSILDNIENEIDDIKKELSYENNFTSAELMELKPYIIVGEWQDESYIDPKDLYMEGQIQLQKKNKSKITINIDYVNFLECIDEQDMWKQLKLGDKIIINYTPLDINSDFRYGDEEYIPSDEEGDL